MSALGDDDTIEIIDTKTHEIVGTLPSGPDPGAVRPAPDGKTALRRQRGRQHGHRHRPRASARSIGEIQVGVEPEGMGVSPDGKILVNTSETTNMAHFIDTATHQIVANVLVDARPRFAEFKPDGSELWVSSEIGGTVSVIDPAKHEVKHKITLRDSRHAQRGDPAGRHPHHPGRQDRLRRARAGQPRRRDRRRRPTRCRSICWSASGSGRWPSRPTRSSCSSPTAFPTTFR